MLYMVATSVNFVQVYHQQEMHLECTTRENMVIRLESSNKQLNAMCKYCESCERNMTWENIPEFCRLLPRD